MPTPADLLVAFQATLAWWPYVLGVGEVIALLTIPSVLLQRRGQPLAALAWVRGLIAAPIVGALAWWAIGRSHLERKRRRRRRAHDRFVGVRSRGDAAPPCRESDLLPLAELTLRGCDGVFPTVPGNRLRLLRDGEETYRALEEVVAAARHHLHFLFYSWAADRVGARFRDLLAERARAGVEVRVLVDALGSPGVAGRFMDPLRRAGGRVAPFLPTRFLRRSLTVNFRNHRKIVVADGRVAYTGGLNIGEEYVGDWRDLGLLAEGPVVAHLQEVFADDWHFATGESVTHPRYFEPGCQPDGPPLLPAGLPVVPCALLADGPDLPLALIHDASFIAITRARERVWVTTPYLIPPPTIQAALRTAVARGVDVRLLVPRRSDQPLTRLAGRSYYPLLLRGGVRIFEYLPAILHEKLWVLDSDLALVGSANLDIRSFRLNFEITCAIHGAEVNRQLAALFEQGLAESEEVTLETVERRGNLASLAEAAMNLVSPLL